MRVLADPRRTALPIAAMTAAGFGLTLYVFYPGIMTFDARYIYQDIAKGFVGDWQSPAMLVLWSLIDPVAPGPASLFLLTAALYWLAFGVLALTVARQSPRIALLVPLLALTPPAFVLVGIIWRDVLFAVAWLLAATLVFAGADRSRMTRAAVQTLGLALVAFGVLLRPNALLAAPLLAAYILWPRGFSWRRLAIGYVPMVLGFYGLVQVVYYGVIGATRQYPVHSVMVFDLGGMSHFSKSNLFPGAWTAEETARIANGCYQPTEWNIYWTTEPCKFVMRRLEDEKIFASPALPHAWRDAVTTHPLAWLRHRAGFFWTFLTGANLTMWTLDADDPSKSILTRNARLMAIGAVHDALKETPLFRVGPWLLLDIILCVVAWRRRTTPAGAFVLGVCGSATVYAMTFFAIGVAPDFRYAWWAVLAGLAGAVAVWLPPAKPQQD